MIRGWEYGDLRGRMEKTEKKENEKKKGDMDWIT